MVKHQMCQPINPLTHPTHEHVPLNRAFLQLQPSQCDQGQVPVVNDRFHHPQLALFQARGH